MPDNMDTTPLTQAQSTLLNAVGNIKRDCEDLGVGIERIELCCIWSIGGTGEKGSWESYDGYASTPGPAWLFGAMLERAAKGMNENTVLIDDPRDPEEDDE